MAVGDSGRNFHTVDDPVQARLLTDPKSQAFFRPFLAREATATSAAEELDADLNAVLYRLKTFQAAGLVHVVREIPRHGRPIKVYRSVHDAYFIPYAVTPFATLEERLLQQLTTDARERAKLQAKRLGDAGQSGQRLYRNDLGETWSDAAEGPDSEIDWLSTERSAAIDFWTDVRLSDKEARDIQRFLYETLKRVEGRGPAVAASEPLLEYRLSVALIPLEE